MIQFYLSSQKKAWVIVYRLNGSKPELLLLKPNPEPGLTYDYYVVTGGVENYMGKAVGLPTNMVLTSSQIPSQKTF